MDRCNGKFRVSLVNPNANFIYNRYHVEKNLKHIYNLDKNCWMEVRKVETKMKVIKDFKNGI